MTLSGDAIGGARTVVTADDGSFVFDELPAGTYDLSAAKDAYVTTNDGAPRAGAPGRAFDVAAGARRRVVLRLPRGAVITGTILDPDGEPVQGVSVAALGRRTTVPFPQYRESGSAALPTDDRGTYRIFGLPAGDYLIAVQPSGRTIGFQGGERVRKMAGGTAGDRTFALAHVYYPSVTDVTQAARVSVGAGEERTGIDVQLQYVPLATISGAVRAGPDWNPAQVSLVRLEEGAGTVPTLGAIADADGRFTFAGVPPGQYRIITRVSRPGAPPRIDASPDGIMRVGPPVHLAGSLDVAVAGEDMTDLTVPLQPSLTMTGRIEFDGDVPPVPLTDLQVAAPATFAMIASGQRFPALHVSGRTLRADGIEPGTYRFSARQVAGGKTGVWRLTSLTAGGVDLLDAPVDIRQNVDGVVATITNRVTTLSGLVRDAAGNGTGHVTVVAFAADRSAWFFDSRRIAAAETGEDGRFVIHNLPPGDYRIAATTGLERNEWFDPAVLDRLAPDGVPLTITGTDAQTVALTIRDD